MSSSKYGLIGILLLGISALLIFSFSVTAQSLPPEGSVVTLTTIPQTPTPAPSYPGTDIALAYLSEKYGLAKDQMVVLDQYQQDYVFLTKSYWFVSTFDTHSDTVYKVLVDLDNKLVSGDLLENLKSPSFNSIMDDMAVAKASVERLKGLEIKTIYNGHGKPFSMEQFIENI